MKILKEIESIGIELTKEERAAIALMCSQITEEIEFAQTSDPDVLTQLTILPVFVTPNNTRRTYATA